MKSTTQISIKQHRWMLNRLICFAVISASLIALSQELRNALKPEHIKTVETASISPITNLTENSEIQGKPISSAAFSGDGNRLFIEVQNDIYLWEDQAGLRKLPFSEFCLHSPLAISQDGSLAIFLASKRVNDTCHANDFLADSTLHFWQEGSSISSLTRISQTTPSREGQEAVKCESAQVLSGDDVLPRLIDTGIEVDKNEQTRSLPPHGPRSRNEFEKCGLNTFPGRWAIQASPTMNKLILYPLPGDSSFTNSSAAPTLFGLTIDPLGKPVATESKTLLDSAQGDERTIASTLSRNVTELISTDAKRFRKKEKHSSPRQDINLDNIDDLLVYAEGQNNPTWFAYSMSGVDSAAKTPASRYGKIYSYQVGLSSSIPVEGDYNGDGLLDFATYTPGDIADWQQNRGIWRIYISDQKAEHIEPSGDIIERRWGGPGEVPMPGDYDGDGKTDIATYSPASSIWKILFSRANWDIAKAQAKINHAGLEITWGTPGDFPITGDFNGDGRTDLATFSINNPQQSPVERSTKGKWGVYYIPLNNSQQRPNRIIEFGELNSTPMTGDYNCDGADEIASYNQQTGQWTILFSGKQIKTSWPLTGNATVSTTSPSNTAPISGDFDGDGCTDLAVFIPLANESQSYIHWVILPSSLSGKGLLKLDPAQGIITRIPWRPMKGTPSQLVRREYIRKVIGHE